MRLLMYRDDGGARLGVLRDGDVLDVLDLGARTRTAGLPADLLGLIDQGEAGLDRLGWVLARPEAVAAPARPLSETRLLLPLRPRGNVPALALNFLAQAQESARKGGTEIKPPTVSTKAVTSLIGPHDPIELDESVTQKLDWEVELGVVIGRAGANIARATALDHVFGYTVVNDISARDLQHSYGGQWFKGKSIDRTSPVGPWIVTRDEVPDPQALRLRLTVNGAVKQDATTADMLMPVHAIIEWLSVGMTLPAGCLIATGTPAGVGNAMNPPERLRPGDVVVSEIEGIGTLRNTVVTTPGR